MQSDAFINQSLRKRFGLKEEATIVLREKHRSAIIEHLRESNFEIQIDTLRIVLAKEFGFCYGVDRAIDYTYETRRMFPDSIIYLTNQITNNSQVNSELREMGIRFLSGGKDENYPLEDVKRNDVVILPAFGVRIEMLKELNKIGCTIVDTTCGSVMHIWKHVEQYARDNFTVIIHGNYNHEETIATASHAIKFKNGKYIIVRDPDEAQLVCDYIRKGYDKESFLMKFEKVTSPNFDPDTDLQCIGVANQTTMPSSESLHIEKMIQEAMEDRFGKEHIKDHFRSVDTFCSATQERQDAIIELGSKKPDLIFVVGGYDSSNTNHLCEISLRYAPTYHISDISCILSCNRLQHKPFGEKEEITTENWLPNKKLTVGITAGASTPDKVIGEVVNRIVECKTELEKIDHRIECIIERASKILNGINSAKLWMDSPLEALGGKTPNQYCDTLNGISEVENILGRIEHGVFS